MRTATGIFLALLLLATQGSAQNGLDPILSAIRKNNKTIAASRQYLEAQKLQSRTGLSPENPLLSTDYLIGRPRSGGDQIDFQLVQPFDFPTAYAKKSRLADRQVELYSLELEQVEKGILWEAQQIGLSLIHRNKAQRLLKRRLLEARGVWEDYQKKFGSGEVSGLSVNKARIQYLEVQHAARNADTEIATLTAKLTELNGGLPIRLTDTLYPGPLTLPSVDSLQNMIAQNDPEMRLHRQTLQVETAELQVMKAMSLPKLEAGYHFQSVLGQTFNGVHVGASIPLWENRNKVKAGESLLVHHEAEEAERKMKIEGETQRLYLQYESLQQSLAEFREALDGLSTTEILRKSLELREIDFITYAMELDYYYKAVDQLLEIEHAYHLAIAELLKSNL